jgi:hypothetical protein
MVRRVVVLLALVVVSLAGPVSAEDRDRRARAALALAAAPKAPPAAVAVAPLPRVAKPKGYAQGHQESRDEQKPLVVFVGMDVVPVDGAIVSKTDAPEFAGVTAPAVVVGYPVGDRLFVERTLSGAPTPAEVKAAVRDAARKIDSPAKDMPAAPKPLDWQIRTIAPAHGFPYQNCGPVG